MKKLFVMISLCLVANVYAVEKPDNDIIACKAMKTNFDYCEVRNRGTVKIYKPETYARNSGYRFVHHKWNTVIDGQKFIIMEVSK